VLSLPNLRLPLDELAIARAMLETLLDAQGMPRLEAEHTGSPAADATAQMCSSCVQ
jgi:hypothetical protein